MIIIKLTIIVINIYYCIYCSSARTNYHILSDYSYTASVSATFSFSVFTLFVLCCNLVFSC